MNFRSRKKGRNCNSRSRTVWFEYRWKDVFLFPFVNRIYVFRYLRDIFVIEIQEFENMKDRRSGMEYFSSTCLYVLLKKTRAQ